MTELFSIKDVAKIFALQESRLRYWAQTGFVGPTVRQRGRFYYTFRDLVSVKAAKELIDAGMPLQTVRRNLDGLRHTLPDLEQPAARLRICSDGQDIVAVTDDVVFEPATGQVVMAFGLGALSQHVAEVLRLPASTAPGAPTPIDDAPTAAHEPPSAYRAFLEACAAEDRGELGTAEALYERAIGLDSSLASAHTNLGNLRYRRGELTAARSAYERALEHEPEQPEARYNLGNLLEDLGETELAIAELRRVVWARPDFADAHYNLGLALARVGGTLQARKHLERYLELDHESEWAGRARGVLRGLVPAPEAAC